MDLLPFQKRFRAAVLDPNTDIACLSLPRGNGKSTLAASFCVEALTPGTPFYREGQESHLVAVSLAQARRTVLAQMVKLLPEQSAFKIATSSTNSCYVERRECGTRISVLTASYRSAQGLVSAPWLFADEPGAWLPGPGQSMFDAIATASAKPGETQLTSVFIGTVAPSRDGWWRELVENGTRGSTYVQALQADPKRWDDLREVRRVNPLMYRFPKSRAKLREERDEARRDSRLKARFLSYRLNVPTEDESSVLLTVEDWKRIVRRPVPEREGRPVVAVDLGGNRAWSAACGTWPNGRTEAVAVAPGIPSIAKQERRDRVPRGTYQRLVDTGILRIAEGLRVPQASQLVNSFRGWRPLGVMCDSFRVHELRDCRLQCPVRVRRTVWSQSSEDIRALRRMALDGNLSVAGESRPLIQESLAASRIENDTSGNSRLIKRTNDNSARDDVAAALVLAGGAAARVAARKPKPLRWVVAG